MRLDCTCVGSRQGRAASGCCIVLVVQEPWHNSGSKNLENFGNLRMLLEHCVGVCLEKRTFQLHVSVDHEKKYSLQPVKVKAPSLCWHRLLLISLSVGTSIQIRETSHVLPWVLPDCYLALPSASPILCQYFSFIKACFCLAHWGPFLSTSDLCLAFGCDHNSLYPDRGHPKWPGEFIYNPGIPSHTASWKDVNEYNENKFVKAFDNMHWYNKFQTSKGTQGNFGRRWIIFSTSIVVMMAWCVQMSKLTQLYTLNMCSCFCISIIPQESC